MKKSSLCFGLIIILLLSSCNNSIVKPSKESSGLYMIAKLPSKRTMGASEAFEVEFGYGRGALYNYATFEIFADGFEITDPYGNVFQDKFIFTFSNFNNDKYYVKNPAIISDYYYENFKFKYIGENAEESGEIQVLLTTLQHGEPSTQKEKNQGAAGSSVRFFYRISKQKIIISNKKFSFNNYV